MLARTLHMKDRCFTYLPNPTSSRWNRNHFSRRRLLSSFCSEILGEKAALSQEESEESRELRSICDSASHVDAAIPQCRDDDLAPLHLNVLRNALDKTDALLRTYHKGLVLDVLRCHVNEILHAAIRLDGEATEEQDSFNNLAFVPRESLERELMEKYFHVIRQRVVVGDLKDSKLPSDAATRNAIWSGLVFRMICWLLLHNFHQNDVQLLDYERDRSNMWVYIA